MRILPWDVVGAPRALTGASQMFLKLLVAGCVAATVSACGGSVDVAVAFGSPAPSSVRGLGIQVTQTAPDQVRVDWSNDLDVSRYVVVRNSTEFASVMATTTLFDTSVVVNAQYCYQVSGYDQVGNLVAASNTACIVVAP